jgi:hypothetical protein
MDCISEMTSIEVFSKDASTTMAFENWSQAKPKLALITL